MLITRAKVDEYLKNFLSSEDQVRLAQYLDLITDLSWMASIVLEYGFQCPCPRDTKGESKKKFFELVQKLSDARKEAKVLVDMNEYPYQPVFKGEKQLTIEDFAVVCDLFHKTVEENKVSKDKLLEWLGEAWDAGIHQQKVHNMEIEGGIMNEYGIVCAFGAELAMFGDRKGLVPESCLR